jgi:hypothetical protein
MTTGNAMRFMKGVSAMADGQLIERNEGEVAVQGDPIFALIERAATDPNFDVAKMEKLLEMQERQQANNAKAAFNRDFVAAKKAIKPLVRNKRNDQTKSNYVDLEAVADAIDPILADHGFAPTFGTAVSDMEGHYKMVCDLLHEDGHERHYEANIPVDACGIKGSRNKTDTHAFGSSTTYGRRYLKLMIFDIATKDDDGNAASPQPETLGPEEMTILDDLIRKSGVNRADFFKYAKVEGMADIHLKNFEPLKKILEAKLPKEEATQ